MLNEKDRKPGYYNVRLPSPGEHGWARGHYWFVCPSGLKSLHANQSRFRDMLRNELGLPTAEVERILAACEAQRKFKNL